MKIVSRVDATKMAVLVSKHRGCEINANEINYEYINVKSNGDVTVGLFDIDSGNMYIFILNGDNVVLDSVELSDLSC